MEFQPGITPVEQEKGVHAAPTTKPTTRRGTSKSSNTAGNAEAGPGPSSMVGI